MKVVMNLCAALCLLLGLRLEAVAVQPHALDNSIRQPGLSRSGIGKEDPAEEKNVGDKIKDSISNGKKKVMNAIEKFRAEICANMKEQYGIEFDTFLACHKFMEKTCKPGEDMSMDGDNHEVSSGKGYCKEYFPEAEKKAKEQVEKEEAAESATATTASSPGPSPGPASAPAPAPSPTKEDKAPAPAPKEASAPAKAGPAPAPAPAPGPAGAPGPAAPLPADEAWYYAKGGKDNGRLHMNADMKLPTQGYWGKLVEHEDMETATSDWQQEFGPKSGHGSIADACKKNPDSVWCMRRGYGKHFRGSGKEAVANILPIAIVFLAACTL